LAGLDHHSIGASIAPKSVLQEDAAGSSAPSSKKKKEKPSQLEPGTKRGTYMDTLHEFETNWNETSEAEAHKKLSQAWQEKMITLHQGMKHGPKRSALFEAIPRVGDTMAA
jgi:hypothetical protein